MLAAKVVWQWGFTVAVWMLATIIWMFGVVLPLFGQGLPSEITIHGLAYTGDGNEKLGAMRALSIDWDVPPAECPSGLYSWRGEEKPAFRCVGNNIPATEDGTPVLPHALIDAVVRSQKENHLAGQNAFMFQSSMKDTDEYLDYKLSERLARGASSKMQVLQAEAQKLCASSGSHEFVPSLIVCQKRKSGLAAMAAALGRRGKDDD